MPAPVLALPLLSSCNSLLHVHVVAFDSVQETFPHGLKTQTRVWIIWIVLHAVLLQCTSNTIYCLSVLMYPLVHRKMSDAFVVCFLNRLHPMILMELSSLHSLARSFQLIPVTGGKSNKLLLFL